MAMVSVAMARGQAECLTESRREASSEEQQQAQLRSLDEIAAEANGPPWYWVAFHLVNEETATAEPFALRTHAPSSSSMTDLQTLAAQHLAILQRPESVRIVLPTWMPVGTGTLLHAFLCSDSVDLTRHTFAWFDGRAIATDVPCICATQIPVPCNLAELGFAASRLSPIAAIRVNDQEMHDNWDVPLRFPHVQPIPRTRRTPGPLNAAVLARLPGVGSEAVSAFLTYTSTTTTVPPCFGRHPGMGREEITFDWFEPPSGQVGVKVPWQFDIDGALLYLQQGLGQGNGQHFASVLVTAPRVYLSPAGQPCVFTFLGLVPEESSWLVPVWVDARPFLPQPTVLALPHICRPSDVRRLLPGLPPEWLLTFGVAVWHDDMSPGSVTAMSKDAVQLATHGDPIPLPLDSRLGFSLECRTCTAC